MKCGRSVSATSCDISPGSIEKALSRLRKQDGRRAQKKEIAARDPARTDREQDATARAIFRAAGYELLRTDAPLEVVIDEYVEIAKSFFEGTEPGFVNGALDGVARDVRPG